MNRLIFTHFMTAAMLLSLTGCDFLGRMMPGTVGDGISRLTVRNAADTIQLLEKNKECGFASKYVLENPTTVLDEADPALGTVTWTVQDCALKFDEPQVVASDCNGNDASVKGGIVLNATKSIHGRLTNNPKQPAIPLTHGDVNIHVEAAFDNFEPTHSEDSYALLQARGAISFDAVVPLARSHLAESKDLCVIPTSDVTLENIAYVGSEVKLQTGLLAFNVPVSKSLFHVQAGLWGERENTLEGKISVYGTEVEVPGDEKGLDPDYLRSNFVDTFKCNAGLEEEVVYECMDMDQKLAQGVGSLSALTIGQIGNTVDLDSACGFSSPEVIQAAQVFGEVGKPGGSALFSIDSPCRLSYATATKLDEDCLGVVRYGEGNVDVLGTKEVVGRRVLREEKIQRNGDIYEHALSDASLSQAELMALKPEPILPDSYKPAIIQMELIFDEFKIYDACEMVGDVDNPDHCSRQTKWMLDLELPPGRDNIKPGPSMLIKKGMISGRISPLLGLETDDHTREYGVCARRIPVATFESIEHADSEVELAVDGNLFPLKIGRTSLWAQSGQFDGEENRIAGSVSLSVQGDNKEMELENLDGTPVALDSTPGYDHDLFVRSFTACDAGIKIPETTEACDTHQMLSENVARLILQNVGGLAKFATEMPPSLCSFKSVTPLTLPYFPPHAGPEASVIYSQKNCQLGGNVDFTLAVDKNEDAMLTSGKAILKRGNLELFGERINSNLPRAARVIWAGLTQNDELHISMKRHDAVTMNLSDVRPMGFSACVKRHNMNDCAGRLVMHDGKLSVKLKPFVGESASKPGHYFIETPVAKFERVAYRDGRVTMHTADGMEFALEVEYAELSGMNGMYHGEGNFVSGKIKLKDMPEVELDIPLVPNYPEPYDQAYFDAAYKSTDDLRTTLSPI